MILKTRGIVLHSIKYGETSAIVNIYTEELGMKGFIIKGIRSKRSKIKPVFFQNLSLLDLVIYYSDKKNLHTIKEVNPAFTFSSLITDIKKASINIFLSEVLYKAIKEEEINREMFQFINNSLIIFDGSQKNFINFHIYFLVHLTKFLGFFPQKNYSTKRPVFNIEEGEFTGSNLSHPNYIDFPASKALFHILESNLESFEKSNISYQNRKILLEKLILFYQFHLPSFKEIKSYNILETIFS